MAVEAGARKVKGDTYKYGFRRPLDASFTEFIVQTESLRCAVKIPRRRMSGSITSKLPKLSLMLCGQVWVLAGWTRW